MDVEYGYVRVIVGDSVMYQFVCNPINALHAK